MPNLQNDGNNIDQHGRSVTPPQGAVLDAVDDAEMIALCSRLVQARSENPPGNEVAPAKIVAEWCRELGGEATLTEPMPGRPNVVARFPGTGSASSLAFSAHMDLVPVKPAEYERWDQDPYGGEVIQGELWGRGSVDMKGGLAAAMAAMKALLDSEIDLPGDLWLLASMDEELEMTGTKAMINSGIIDSVGAAVVCEPTNLQLDCASKGRTWATIGVLGEAAHARFKDGGVNAITNALRLAASLDETTPEHRAHHSAGDSWWTITEIEGGLGPAIIPDRCDLTLDVRLVPGQRCDAVWDEMREVIDRLTSELPDFRCEVEVVERREPWEIEHQSHIATAMATGLKNTMGTEPGFDAFPGTADASFLAPAGIPCVICGPGDLARAHRENERIPLTELSVAARSYALAAIEFFKITMLSDLES
ncbi:M20 family metallopeptidase [soil metagenome]